jgi:hypothetical protein
MQDALIAVVETPEFLRQARKFMDDERASLVDHLARHPGHGDLIQGGGGIRKLRWALPGNDADRNGYKRMTKLLVESYKMVRT